MYSNKDLKRTGKEKQHLEMQMDQVNKMNESQIDKEEVFKAFNKDDSIEVV